MRHSPLRATAPADMAVELCRESMIEGRVHGAIVVLVVLALLVGQTSCARTRSVSAPRESAPTFW